METRHHSRTSPALPSSRRNWLFFNLIFQIERGNESKPCQLFFRDATSRIKPISSLQRIPHATHSLHRCCFPPPPHSDPRVLPSLLPRSQKIPGFTSPSLPSPIPYLSLLIKPHASKPHHYTSSPEHPFTHPRT